MASEAGAAEVPLSRAVQNPRALPADELGFGLGLPEPWGPGAHQTQPKKQDCSQQTGIRWPPTENFWGSARGQKGPTANTRAVPLL